MKERRHIDSGRASVNFSCMDPDDLSAKRPEDPLTQLCKQDLDPLSVTELEARIVALEEEIERVRAKVEGAVSHKKAAEQLFKR